MRHWTVGAAAIMGSILAGVAAQADSHPELAAAGEAFLAGFNSGDGAAAASHYSENAILLPPNAPRIDGREGIAGYWGGAFEAGVSNLSVESTDLDVLGDTAIDVGNWRVSVPDGNGGTMMPTGKYLIIWKRNADGVWEVHRDIWNDDPPG